MPNFCNATTKLHKKDTKRINCMPLSSLIALKGENMCFVSWSKCKKYIPPTTISTPINPNVPGKR